MPVNAKAVQITNVADSDVVTTGLGFTPKTGVFFGNACLASVTGQVHFRPWIGLVGAGGVSDQVGAVFMSQDNLADSDAKTEPVTANGGAGLKILADGTNTDNNSVLSWDADGLTTHNTGAAGYVSHGLLLGGGDLRNAKTFSFVTPTSPGQVSVTGIGFKGDLVILFYSGPNPITQTTWHCMCMGWATSPTNHGTAGVFVKDAEATTFARRYQATDAALTLFNQSAVISITLASFDSDGLTFDVGDTGGDAFTIYGMVIKGCSAKCGTFDASGGSPDKSITGVGFRPRALLVMGTCSDPGLAHENHAHFYFGAASSADAAQQFVIASGDRTALATSDSEENTLSGQCGYVRVFTKAWGDFIKANVTSFDVDGFSLNFPVQIGAYITNEHLYLAIGDKPTVQINGGSILGGKIAAVA